MIYHIKKVINNVKERMQMLRLVLNGKSFLIAYKCKLSLDYAAADELLFICVNNDKKPLNKQNSPKTKDIRFYPYQLAQETRKEYLARIRAGQIK